MPLSRTRSAGCHLGSASELIESGGSALCYACHADLEIEVQVCNGAARGPRESRRCTVCHSPHASRQPRLLRAPGGGICLNCHEDQGKGADQIGHGTVDWFGCQSCHLPHGGSQPKLLREVGNELCLGCHLEENINRADGVRSRATVGDSRCPRTAPAISALVVLDPLRKSRPPDSQPSSSRHC